MQYFIKGTGRFKHLLLVLKGHAIIVAMKVSEIGEFGLIDLFHQMVNRYQDKNSPSWNKLLIGIGDDAAAWHSERGVEMITTDSFIEDVHFSPSFFTWSDIGWKALAINLSDIAAMGAIPRYAVVSMAIPEHTSVKNVTLLYRGIIELAEQTGIAIVGGNISGADKLMINITLTAITPNAEAVLTRCGARAGDKVAVTGYLGAAATGLEILRGNIDTGDEQSESLKKAFLHPLPRIAEGQFLARNGIRAAIDISDGFHADLEHLCTKSGLGARIETERIPVHPDLAALLGNRAIEMALAGGEDYELIFTGPLKNINQITAQIKWCPISIVGEMVAQETGKVMLVDSCGKLSTPVIHGWEHLKKNI